MKKFSFKKINSPDIAAEYVASLIKQKLIEDKKVLWLVPGGSAITVAVLASQKLKGDGIDLKNLIISLTDERYGEIGHSDSSWFQLKKSGFETGTAIVRPVLKGDTLDETVKIFDKALENEIKEVDFRIGLFGIGPDGHTAGILPHSPAVLSETYACGYTGGIYERITITPRGIKELDEIIVYAVGNAKWPVFESLNNDDISFEIQPAQALKQVPTLTIFNDHIGE